MRILEWLLAFHVLPWIFVNSFQPILPLGCHRRNVGTIERPTESNLSMSKNGDFHVIYQRVIRAKDSNPMFLPSLVDFVQTQFELPKELPMVYTSTVPENDEGFNDYSILTLNSPLSRSPDATRVDIEVLGVFSKKDNQNEVGVPDMAMVVMKKMKQSEKLDVMMKRMFDDSETKIKKALDAGLDDFAEGRVKQYENSIQKDDGEWSALDSLDKYEGFDQEDGLLEDLMVASADVNLKKVKNEIIDAVVSDVIPDQEGEGKQTKRDRSVKKSVQVEDFAVQAAKEAAAARRNENDSKVNLVDNGDFAVNAAKAAAKLQAKRESSSAQRKSKHQWDDIEEQDSSPVIPPIRKSKSEPPSKKKPGTVLNESKEQQVSMGGTISTGLPSDEESPMLNRLRLRNSFKVSSPKTFNRRNKLFDRAIEDKSKKEGKRQREINVVNLSSVDTNSMSEDERQKSLDQIGFQQMSGNQPGKQSQSTIENGKITKTTEEIEEDVLKAAMNIMPGALDEDPSTEMSAEELLKDILKFGEDNKKAEKGGSSFAKGAFSKAKELTEKVNNVEVGYKEISTKSMYTEDIKYEQDGDKEASKNTLSAEEELKRIFAAGQSIAEGRMTESFSSRKTSDGIEVEKTIVTDEYVDDLIQSEKTISGNVRTLDDELAELELRIGKSPGEDTEAYGPNALFDVFSGPEVYNPNVDPATSVNWPGAKPGTRTDIRLPPELSEATKSAKFAAKLLSKIIEEEQDGEEKVFYIDGKKISNEQVQRLRRAVDEGVAVGFIEDPAQYMKERSRLQIMLNELSNQPEERFGEIAAFYKDLLLSENFVMLLKEHLRAMANAHLEMKRSGSDPSDLEAKHSVERRILGQMVQYSQSLLKEAQALGAELETAQLEVIRSICNVAMDPNHATEEETAEALSDAVRDMKPLLDENFVAYLKYAIAEEKARLARAGLLGDPEHNRWLFVLEIVQEGVYAELSVGVRRYIDHIGYVLRMDTKKERRQLLSKLIDVMPSMDVRPFVKVVDNIAASLGQGTKGEFDIAVLGGMTNKILQLRRDVHDLLPPERIKLMSKDADEWAARQREKLMEQRGVSQQRLKSARDSQSLEDEIGRRGEVERFT